MEIRIGDKQGGGGGMRELVRMRLAQKVGGHGHAGDAFELPLRHIGSSSNGSIGNRTMERDETKDVEVAEPPQAGDLLILSIY